MDGSTWMFSVMTEEHQFKCGGINAYPAFCDPLQTTLERERYALLLAAMYDSFNIDFYIQTA